jgi:hypothetical protein
VFDVWLHESLKLMKRVTQCPGHNQDCSRQTRRWPTESAPLAVRLFFPAKMGA